MAMINMHDAKTQLSDLVARAEAGEEIVIARRNKPVVRLVPLDASGDATPAGRKHAPETAVERGDSTPSDRGFGKKEDGTTQQAGFGETEQAGFDLAGLPEAVERGREFTIMKYGKPVAKVVPVETDGRMSIREARRRIPGRFVHLRSTMREGDWLAPLPENELRAWEGTSPSDSENAGS